MNEIASARDAWASLAAWGLRRRGEALLVVEEPRGRRPASLWTLVNVFSAAMDLTEAGVSVPLDDLLDPLPRYRTGDGYAPTPTAKRRYFDDNAWLGLVSLRLLELTEERSHLRRARRIFSFLQTGQDPDGGIRWVEGKGSRNTCSTAPSAALALSLYLIEEDPTMLAFARDALAWMDSTLRDPQGHYADHQDRGRIDRTLWSYNQGMAAGANRRLALVTGSNAANAVARTTALASFETFHDDRIWQEPPPFLAIWFRELRAFDDPAVHEQAGALLTRYGERLLHLALDPATGRFPNGGVGSYDGRATIDQAAIVQLLTLAAGALTMPTQRTS